MADIKCRIAARCEAAGRPNNEDNFLVSDNLTKDEWGFLTDKEITLSDKGALLVVADGMGGMKAGEVASALAVKTIKEWFATANITDKTVSSTKSIKDFIKKGIQEADAVIKKESSNNETTSGMGSTIAMTWLTGEGQVFAGWCGDSRVYRYNPKDGLILLSHDHSYVQELVDNGKLDASLAFDYPDKNIITRSLGNPNKKAEPDVKEFFLRSGDIYLLCSDGLSGVLRDAEIETIISHNTNSLAACRDALWQGAFDAGWEDNVTLILCQALKVGDMPFPEPSPIPFIQSQPTLRQHDMFIHDDVDDAIPDDDTTDIITVKPPLSTATATPEVTDLAETATSKQEPVAVETSEAETTAETGTGNETPAIISEQSQETAPVQQTLAAEQTVGAEDSKDTENAASQPVSETAPIEKAVIEEDISHPRKHRWVKYLIIIAVLALLSYAAYYVFKLLF